MRPRQILGSSVSVWGLLRVFAGCVLLTCGLTVDPARADPQVMDVPEVLEVEAEFVDRVVATVDGDPVLASDIERVVGLGLMPPGEDESEPSRRRRVLDLLIGERLRFHELERLGLDDVSVDDAAAHLALLSRHYPSYRAVLRRVGRDGMDDASVRRILAGQVMTLTFIEEQMGPDVFVTDAEIEAYYRQTYRRRSAPPLDQSRERVRALVKEQKLQAETVVWTTQLRSAAEIVDAFDLAAGESLPPDE